MNGINEIYQNYKKSKIAVLGLILLILIIIIAVFANFIAPYGYDEQNLNEILLKSSAEHIMGTDNFGRDIFSRIIYGARISLFIGFVSVFFSMFAGIIIGSVAGYFKYFDNILMRIMDVILSIPQLIFAIALSAALGNGMKNLIIAISISAIPRYAKIVRSQFLSLKETEFVEAARVTGAGNLKIITRYILPNSIEPIIVESTLGVGTAILSAAALSFIGMGIVPPKPEWGQMLSEGRAYIRTFPYMTLFPGMVIALTILVLNIVGDGLRDALDPKRRK